jgi:HSP20 family protein
MYQFQMKPFRSSSWMSHGEWDKDLEQFFDSFSKNSQFTPVCEVINEEKHYLISLDIPGLSKEDLEIELKDNELHISGERRPRAGMENVLKNERRYGKFSRIFTLPKDTDSGRIEARFENGVLDILLPKEARTTTKKIIISDWSRKDSEVDLKS